MFFSNKCLYLKDSLFYNEYAIILIFSFIAVLLSLIIIIFSYMFAVQKRETGKFFSAGIRLVLYYTAHIDLAFSSVEHIIREVNNGWLICYIRTNGASMFFIVVYCHIFRGLYFGSYMQPRQLL